MASTITLANTIAWAKPFVSSLDPTINVGFEPALTSANIIKQTILGPPFRWRTNRIITGFVGVSGLQDYLLTTWAASTTLSVNTFIIDTNGNSQQVTTGGTTGSSAPTWNTTTNGTTTDNTVTWTNLGPIPGASPSYTFNFIETVSVQDISHNPAKWFEIKTKINLGVDSSQARPGDISAQKDDNAGNITFRLMPVPDKAYPVAITLQQKAGLFVSTTDKWSPIPDEFSYIYNWGFLALLFMYNDDPRFAVCNQKFIASLLSVQQGLTETERNIFLNQWEALSGQAALNTMKLQQGVQARGA